MEGQIDKQYFEHQIFSQLKEYSEFYYDLADSVMGWVTTGTTIVTNPDTYLYSSIQGTLSSIYDVLKKGRINDAYALLRKYYDSTIINVYTILYLEDNVSFEDIIVKQIENWLNGTERLPPYRIMSQYIRNSSKLTPISELLDADRYKRIRQRCNDHMHYNQYVHVLINDKELYLKNRLNVLNNFSHDLRHLFTQHIAYLFYLNSHYMMSSDYVDYMDAGLTPPPGCENFVAPFIQKVFDVVIKRPDIVAALREKTDMQLS